MKSRGFVQRSKFLCSGERLSGGARVREPNVFSLFLNVRGNNRGNHASILPSGVSDDFCCTKSLVLVLTYGNTIIDMKISPNLSLAEIEKPGKSSSVVKAEILLLPLLGAIGVAPRHEYSGYAVTKGGRFQLGSFRPSGD